MEARHWIVTVLLVWLAFWVAIAVGIMDVKDTISDMLSSQFSWKKVHVENVLNLISIIILTITTCVGIIVSFYYFIPFEKLSGVLGLVSHTIEFIRRHVPSRGKDPDQPPFINTIGMAFVLISDGEFTMGTPREQLDTIAGDDKDYRNRIENQTPQHQVEISQPFYLGKYPVTQRQWEMVMGDNPSMFKGDKLPVEWVSWDDVQVFIERLNDHEGVDLYRLPMEA